MPFPTRQGHLLSSVHLRWLVQPSQEDLYYYWRNRFVPVSFYGSYPQPQHITCSLLRHTISLSFLYHRSSINRFRSPQLLPLSPSSGYTILSTFSYTASLKLSKDSKHLHHHSAFSTGEVFCW
ncbi:Uncharacterised protein [Klebsiella pneumoniae]|nr:Uncharacterised protein [Klebsiella pneumoniae]